MSQPPKDIGGGIDWRPGGEVKKRDVLCKTAGFPKEGKPRKRILILMRFLLILYKIIYFLHQLSWGKLRKWCYRADLWEFSRHFFSSRSAASSKGCWDAGSFWFRISPGARFWVFKKEHPRPSYWRWAVRRRFWRIPEVCIRDLSLAIPVGLASQCRNQQRDGNRRCGSRKSVGGCAGQCMGWTRKKSRKKPRKTMNLHEFTLNFQ